jgi:ATPase subunit of ABC transporter with duplicated ATPase domains
VDVAGREHLRDHRGDGHEHEHRDDDCDGGERRIGRQGRLARRAAPAAPRSSRQPCRRLRTMTPASSLTLITMIDPPPLPQPMPIVVLELRGVSQAYGKRVAVKGVSLTLRRGDIGCLLGPSGCGKTLGRCCARLPVSSPSSRAKCG